MKLDVINLERNITDNVEIPFFLENIRYDIVHQVVNWQLSKRRNPVANTKTVSQIQGSTRKIYRQKGTGSARHGSLKKNIFRGGASIFGPKVKDGVRKTKINKKVRKLALKYAISEKIFNKSLIIVKNFKHEFLKTKDFLQYFPDVKNTKTLFVDVSFTKSFIMSSNNLRLANTLLLNGLNVYDIILHTQLYISYDAIKTINEKLL